MRLNIYFKSSVDVYPSINVRVMVDSGNGLYDLVYVNRTVDVCRILRDSKYEPFLQLVLRTSLHSANYPRKCPIGKVILYLTLEFKIGLSGNISTLQKLFYVKNLVPNPEDFPPVLPEKKFYFAIRLLSKNGSALKPLVAYKIYIEIKNK